MLILCLISLQALDHPLFQTHAVSAVASVMSDSVPPHRRQRTRLLRPWDFPGKSTAVGCQCLLLQPHEEAIIVTISQGRLLRHRKVNSLAWDHPAHGTWQRQDLAQSRFKPAVWFQNSPLWPLQHGQGQSLESREGVLLIVSQKGAHPILP